MPNWFTYVALVSWALVAIWLYKSQPVGRATLLTILGAQLLLPVGVAIKFAGIPPFDKVSIPNLSAVVGCFFIARRPGRTWTKRGIAEILMAMFLIGPFITTELNTDPIVLDDKILPAGTYYDAMSALFYQCVVLIPFILGRQVLRNSNDNAEILRLLVIAGLIYSVPMLFEIRMSPQLHYWFYGYQPTAFIQAMRDGGFRPMVFMGHGLPAAFFMMTAAVAAAALWRTKTSVKRLPPAGVTGYLVVVLALCKSLGALIYCIVLVPLVRFVQPRTQMRIAVVLAAIALAYPMLRLVDLVPTATLTEWAGLINSDRADSLKTRFYNEDQLLERASQRLYFGWGRWGRSRIYEEGGKDVSITDGGWIITLGQFGLFGFFAEFGLLALPIFRAAVAFKFTRSMADRVYLAALTLILTIYVVDTLPNNALVPWTWLLAGALLGRAEALRAVVRERATTYSRTVRTNASI